MPDDRPTYCAIVWPHNTTPAPRGPLVLTIDTRWAEERERYGDTAEAIALAVAGDYADAGTVRVVNLADTTDAATARRAA